MAGGEGDDVGVLAVGLAEVVVQAVEEERLHEAPRGDRAAGVARGGHVVEEQGAERAVDEVDGLEVGELLGRKRSLAGPCGLSDVHVDRTPGTKAE